MTNRRLRSQAGFTMIEVIVAMALMTLVLGVASQAFTSLWDEHKTTTEHNETADIARIAVDRLSRDLRNLASPTALTTSQANRPQAVERAETFDLVFRIVDEKPPPAGSANTANLMRARYCLDRTNKSNNKLYMQGQRWTTAAAPSAPPPGVCPGPGWDTTTLLASNLSNANGAGGTERPLFGFNSSQIDQITRVRTQVFVDPTPGRRPVETQLVSGVGLRNQNQYPLAKFSATPVGVSGSNRLVRLDGSASRDPEAQTLRFCWYVNPSASVPGCTVTPKPSSYVGEGIVLTVSLPSAAQRVVLVVEDPAGLRDEEEMTV